MDITLEIANTQHPNVMQANIGQMHQDPLGSLVGAGVNGEQGIQHNHNHGHDTDNPDDQDDPNDMGAQHDMLDPLSHMQFPCHVIGCDKVFKKATTLARHTRTHSGDRPFQCPVPGCEKSFAEKSNLKTHQRTHTGDRPYRCTERGCDRSFAQAGTLITHRRTHTGDRPFVCDVEGCGRSFAEKSNLVTHRRTHTGEKPFRCLHPGCNRSFSSSYNLKTHARTHSGDRPFCCEFEGCAKKFATSGNLKTHLRIHTGEKPFVCSFPGCAKSFTTAGNLKTHKKVHTGDRPFVCNFQDCNKRFSTAGNLKSHIQTNKHSLEDKLVKLGSPMMSQQSIGGMSDSIGSVRQNNTISSSGIVEDVTTQNEQPPHTVHQDQQGQGPAIMAAVLTRKHQPSQNTQPGSALPQHSSAPDAWQQTDTKLHPSMFGSRTGQPVTDQFMSMLRTMSDDSHSHGQQTNGVSVVNGLKEVDENGGMLHHHHHHDVHDTDEGRSYSSHYHLEPSQQMMNHPHAHTVTLEDALQHQQIMHTMHTIQRLSQPRHVHPHLGYHQGLHMDDQLSHLHGVMQTPYVQQLDLMTHDLGQLPSIQTPHPLTVPNHGLQAHGIPSRHSHNRTSSQGQHHHGLSHPSVLDSPSQLQSIQAAQQRAELQNLAVRTQSLRPHHHHHHTQSDRELQRHVQLTHNRSLSGHSQMMADLGSHHHLHHVDPDAFIHPDDEAESREGNQFDVDDQ